MVLCLLKRSALLGFFSSSVATHFVTSSSTNTWMALHLQVLPFLALPALMLVHLHHSNQPPLGLYWPKCTTQREGAAGLKGLSPVWDWASPPPEAVRPDHRSPNEPHMMVMRLVTILAELQPRCPPAWLRLMNGDTPHPPSTRRSRSLIYESGQMLSSGRHQ